MSDTILHPIETIYKGFRFRSRLEARWAVFFDRLDSEWAYEPEGFRLPSGPYLPDFRFSFREQPADLQPTAFFEVKPLTSLPIQCFEFGLGVRTEPINDQFPLEITKMWELIKGLNRGKRLRGPIKEFVFGFVVYGDPYDVVTGGTLVFVYDRVFVEPEIFRKCANEAIAARSARFEHNERWRHEDA